MNTLQLKLEIERNLDLLEQDETLLHRTLNYIRRLVTKKQKDDALMTEEEFFARVDEAMEQARQGKVYRQMPGESFAEFRNRIGR